MEMAAELRQHATNALLLDPRSTKLELFFLDHKEL